MASVLLEISWSLTWVSERIGSTSIDLQIMRGYDESAAAMRQWNFLRTVEGIRDTSSAVRLGLQSIPGEFNELHFSKLYLLSHGNMMTLSIPALKSQRISCQRTPQVDWVAKFLLVFSRNYPRVLHTKWQLCAWIDCDAFAPENGHIIVFSVVILVWFPWKLRQILTLFFCIKECKWELCTDRLNQTYIWRHLAW